jgi:hypothetical protein
MVLFFKRLAQLKCAIPLKSVIILLTESPLPFCIFSLFLVQPNLSSKILVLATPVGPTDYPCLSVLKVKYIYVNNNRSRR